MLRHVFPSEDANALVDSSTGDDAAVYLLEPNRALVVTADFFTPIVDDPFQFGQIAAANALSDLYAMGAKPLFALNLLAFPRAHLEEGSLAEMIRGGAEKVREAGIAVLGGHSIDDPEPKYGLVAVGEVDPAEMTTNAGARAGDLLVLTKAIGTGIIATAIKENRAEPAAIDAAVRSMAALNKDAAAAARAAGLRAATDVTGFGLLGHLRQMLLASGVAADVRSGMVPVLPGAWELATTSRFPAGSIRNLEDVKGDVAFSDEVPEPKRLLLADAQTSGGLLLAAPAGVVPDLLARLHETDPVAAVIGEVKDGRPGQIRVV